MIKDLFTATVIIGIISSGIRLATPYLYAAIGEMFGQRSGVLNLGVEGQMLLGAFVAYFVVLRTESLLLAILAAIGVGALMGLAMGFVTIQLQATQGIAGIGFYLFGMGMSNLLFQKLIGVVENIDGFSAIKIPLLGDIPVIGEIFFRQNLLVYLAFLLVPLAWFVLNKTTLGLKIRAVGENPEAADTLGINVFKTRYFGVLMSGALSSLGGAFLSVGELGRFVENMIHGRGFIALAAMILGNWNPAGAMWAALLFGAATLRPRGSNSLVSSRPEL